MARLAGAVGRLIVPNAPGHGCACAGFHPLLADIILHMSAYGNTIGEIIVNNNYLTKAYQKFPGYKPAGARPHPRAGRPSDGEQPCASIVTAQPDIPNENAPDRIACRRFRIPAGGKFPDHRYVRSQARVHREVGAASTLRDAALVLPRRATALTVKGPIYVYRSTALGVFPVPQNRAHSASPRGYHPCK